MCNVSDSYLCITSYKLTHEKNPLKMPGSLCVMDPPLKKKRITTKKYNQTDGEASYTYKCISPK